MSRLADVSFDGRVRQSVSKGAVRGWVVVSIALDLTYVYLINTTELSEQPGW